MCVFRFSVMQFSSLTICFFFIEEFFRYWVNNRCVNLKTFNNTCSSNRECDSSDYLTCISGRCDCNSTQFWNNGSREKIPEENESLCFFALEFCENKKMYGGQCFSTYWCNSATSGLQCSTWEPTAGRDSLMRCSELPTIL